MWSLQRLVDLLELGPERPMFTGRGWKLGALLALAALLYITFVLLRPLPGRTLSLATGPEGSSSAIVGEHYREILAQRGVTLKLVLTDGASENLARLADPKQQVDAAFVDAGTTKPGRTHGIESLGSVYYEPLWFFCRCVAHNQGLQELAGLRVSIGPEGSGHRALALQLFALNKVESDTLQIFDFPPAVAVEKLEHGDLDGVMLLSGWESPNVKRLLADPDIGLVGFARADAYVALLPFLRKVTVPMGIGNLAANRPPTDTTLLATEKILAIRSSMHPALQYLLLEAAYETHGGSGLFHRAGELPAGHVTDLPLSAEARAYYKSGPSILQRHMPFWLAALVQRLLLVILPLVAVVYPLWNVLPRIYLWIARRRLFQLYGELRFVEDQLRISNESERPALLARLGLIDQEAAAKSLPRALSPMRYSLRTHVALVQRVYGARAS